MIAKLIAAGTTRDEALDRLAAALAETEVTGVTTNLPFLRWLVAHPCPPRGRHDNRVPQRASASFGAAGGTCRIPSGAARSDSTCLLRRRCPHPMSMRTEHAHGVAAGSGTIVAPMPGTVIKVNVRPGDRVKAHDALVVLEAMKMETPLLAPADASVRAVHVEEGDRVAGDAILVELDD